MLENCMNFVIAYLILSYGFKFANIRLEETFDQPFELFILILFTFGVMITLSFSLGFKPSVELFINIGIFLLALFIKSMVSFER